MCCVGVQRQSLSNDDWVHLEPKHFVPNLLDTDEIFDDKVHNVVKLTDALFSVQGKAKIPCSDTKILCCLNLFFRSSLLSFL